MLSLENQVCSLELSKRLNELGIKQESLFYWGQYAGVGIYKICSPYFLEEYSAFSIAYKNLISAFTVAELGEMLNITFPLGVKGQNQFYMSLNIRFGIRSVSLEHNYDAGFSDRTDVVYLAEGNTEADARAKMLIYLLERGLIKNESA